jgi:hypothetical protein
MDRTLRVLGWIFWEQMECLLLLTVNADDSRLHAGVSSTRMERHAWQGVSPPASAAASSARLPRDWHVICNLEMQSQQREDTADAGERCHSNTADAAADAAADADQGRIQGRVTC